MKGCNYMKALEAAVARQPRPIRPFEQRLDGSRTWVHRPTKAFELGSAVAVGDLVYTAPAPELRRQLEVVRDMGDDDGDRVPRPPPRLRYDSLRGEAPGFAELTNTLARRSMRLISVGAYYWRVEATS